MLNPNDMNSPQLGVHTYKIITKRRESTPSPNRFEHSGSSIGNLVSNNDVYEDYHTNSLGRGQTIISKRICKDHYNDSALHRSTSPLLKRYVHSVSCLHVRRLCNFSIVRLSNNQ